VSHIDPLRSWDGRVIASKGAENLATGRERGKICRLLRP
jgi:hypothetical protein